MQWTMARRAERLNPSTIREILKITERPGIISLAGGLPSPDTFPIEAMREATARVLRDAPREALQYAASGFGGAASNHSSPYGLSSTSGSRSASARAAIAARRASPMQRPLGFW